MAKQIVPFPTAAVKAQEEERIIAEHWAKALREALAVRGEQEYRYPLKNSPEIRDLAKRIGPFVGGYGLDSPVTYRAIAMLVTMCHPIVLAAMLAGVPTKAEAAARRRKRGRR